jgi:hypothetical protein
VPKLELIPDVAETQNQQQQQQPSDPEPQTAPTMSEKPREQDSVSKVDDDDDGNNVSPTGSDEDHGDQERRRCRKRSSRSSRNAFTLVQENLAKERDQHLIQYLKENELTLEDIENDESVKSNAEDYINRCMQQNTTETYVRNGRRLRKRARCNYELLENAIELKPETYLTEDEIKQAYPCETTKRLKDTIEALCAVCSGRDSKSEDDCEEVEELMICALKGCTNAYHFNCLGPEDRKKNSTRRPNLWICPDCIDDELTSTPDGDSDDDPPFMCDGKSDVDSCEDDSSPYSSSYSSSDDEDDDDDNPDDDTDVLDCRYGSDWNLWKKNIREECKSEDDRSAIIAMGEWLEGGAKGTTSEHVSSLVGFYKEIKCVPNCVGLDKEEQDLRNRDFLFTLRLWLEDGTSKVPLLLTRLSTFLGSLVDSDEFDSEDQKEFKAWIAIFGKVDDGAYKTHSARLMAMLQNCDIVIPDDRNGGFSSSEDEKGNHAEKSTKNKRSKNTNTVTKNGCVIFVFPFLSSLSSLSLWAYFFITTIYVSIPSRF